MQYFTEHGASQNHWLHVQDELLYDIDACLEVGILTTTKTLQ
jgi:hypothetical protein